MIIDLRRRDILVSYLKIFVLTRTYMGLPESSHFQLTGKGRCRVSLILATFSVNCDHSKFHKREK